MFFRFFFSFAVIFFSFESIANVDCSRIRGASYRSELRGRGVDLVQAQLRCRISNTNLQPRENDNDQAVRTTSCESITAYAPNQSGPSISLYACTYSGPADEGTPQAFFFDEAGTQPYSGIIDKLNDRYYYYSGGASSELPDSFNCSGRNGNAMQCLVCNCFFEARGQTLEEQLMVSRVVHSRVLSPVPIHGGNDICSVVHAPGPQFEWISQNAFNTGKSKVLFTLGEGSGTDLVSKRPQDLNSYRKCVRSARESMQYKDQFFAAYYVKKTHPTPAWLNTCKQRSASGEVSLGPNENRISRNDLAHNFYKICDSRENRCVTSPTCLRQAERERAVTAPARSLRPRARPTDVVE